MNRARGKKQTCCGATSNAGSTIKITICTPAPPLTPRSSRSDNSPDFLLESRRAANRHDQREGSVLRGLFISRAKPIPDYLSLSVSTNPSKYRLRVSPPFAIASPIRKLLRRFNLSTGKPLSTRGGAGRIVRGNILRLHYSIDRSWIQYADRVTRAKGQREPRQRREGAGGNRGRRNEERACVRLSVFARVRRRQSRSLRCTSFDGRERERGEEGDREETTYVSSSTRGRRIYNGITFPRLYFGSKNAVSVPISSLPFSSIRTSMLFCETNSGPSSAPLA